MNKNQRIICIDIIIHRCAFISLKSVDEIFDELQGQIVYSSGTTYYEMNPEYFFICVEI